MVKVDCYLGVDSKEMWGINRYKIAVFENLVDSELEKKKVVYKIPKEPAILNRLANFFDMFTYSPLAVVKHRRQDAVALLLAHPEAYLLNYFKFKKSVVICHDILPLQFKLTGWLSSMKLRFAFRGMLKADRIIAIAEGVKDDIVNYLNYPAERIDVVISGADHDHFKVIDGDFSDVRRKYGVPEGKRIILFLASEEPRKNFPIVLKAFAKLKKRMPDIVLLKAGKAGRKEFREDNLRLIKKLGISKDVIFTGYVSEEDVPLVYNMSDIFAYPTLYEGAMSLPLFEAMACGCPVVSTKYVVETTGDIPSMMKNATDVDELESLMYRVLNDKAFRQKVARFGLERAKDFRWENTGKGIAEVIKRVAAEI
ncbi:MAG: glycosyltransferase family 1 protein [archaeon]